MGKITAFEQRQKLKFLRDKINEGCSIDHIANQLSGPRGLIPFSTFSCSDITNDPIYRARLNLSGKLFKNITELSYPPLSVTSKGRCNRKGESTLYASTSELGTIVENVAAGMSLDTLFTIAVIRKKPIEGKLLFKGFGIQEVAVKLDKYGKEFNDFCNEQFSRIINKNSVSEDDYNFTIALYEHFTNKRVVTVNPITKKKEKINFHMALVYPSVHSKITTNKTVYNLAIKPEVFDIYYEICEAY